MKKLRNSYIAISSILLIMTIITIISLTTSTLVISTTQISLSEKIKNELLNLVESCAEDALLYLNKNNNLPSQIILPQITCNINLNNQIGQTFDFDVKGSKNNYEKTINIKATRSNTIIIEKWIEK